MIVVTVATLYHQDSKDAKHTKSVLSENLFVTCSKENRC